MVFYGYYTVKFMRALLQTCKGKEKSQRVRNPDDEQNESICTKILRFFDIDELDWQRHSLFVKIVVFIFKFIRLVIINIIELIKAIKTYAFGDFFQFFELFNVIF